jgi:tRNA uridine 5-carbamoylmethylation protein Kti12
LASFDFLKKFSKPPPVPEDVVESVVERFEDENF